MVRVRGPIGASGACSSSRSFTRIEAILPPKWGRSVTEQSPAWMRTFSFAAPVKHPLSHPSLLPKTSSQACRQLAPRSSSSHACVPASSAPSAGRSTDTRSVSRRFGRAKPGLRQLYKGQMQIACGAGQKFPSPARRSLGVAAFKLPHHDIQFRRARGQCLKPLVVPQPPIQFQAAARPSCQSLRKLARPASAATAAASPTTPPPPRRPASTPG